MIIETFKKELSEKDTDEKTFSKSVYSSNDASTMLVFDIVDIHEIEVMENGDKVGLVLWEKKKMKEELL